MSTFRETILVGAFGAIGFLGATAIAPETPEAMRNIIGTCIGGAIGLGISKIIGGDDDDLTDLLDMDIEDVGYLILAVVLAAIFILPGLLNSSVVENMMILYGLILPCQVLSASLTVISIKDETFDLGQSTTAIAIGLLIAMMISFSLSFVFGYSYFIAYFISTVLVIPIGYWLAGELL